MVTFLNQKLVQVTIRIVRERGGPPSPLRFSQIIPSVPPIIPSVLPERPQDAWDIDQDAHNIPNVAPKIPNVAVAPQNAGDIELEHLGCWPGRGDIGRDA